ncbi:MAG TPA: glycosyltransferase family 2 protein, partial [Gemmatimonadaceae bacterium]|nr:glycosyltransferase family 2 protein [Gemmatimonadaceae bacterium]
KSVLAFELPQSTAVEVLVLDGMSTDGTREIVREVAARDARVRLVDNPKRIQSEALNLGLSVARGEYVMRLDAPSVYPTTYLALCLETAVRTGADNTGGVVTTMRRGDGYQAALVQALITHKFGVGNSGFRTDAMEGPADTVPYGFFRREIFSKVGLFDLHLLRAQDYEMNRRIINSGGKIWRNPAIDIEYYPQPDFASFIRKQFMYEAPYNAYMWYVAPYSFALRHAITAVFSLGVIGGLLLSPFSSIIRTTFILVMALYLVLAILAAAQQAIRYREPRHILFLPLSFFAYHFLHGLGVIVGLFRLAVGSAPVQRSLSAA